MPSPVTDEQRRLVDSLKELLQARGLVLTPDMLPCGNEDASLLRLLNARQKDVAKTAALIESTLAWRIENKASDALTTFLNDETEANLTESIPSGYIGFTKEGHPVKLEYTTKINVQDMLNRGVTMDDFVFYHMREMEYLVQVQFQEAADRAGVEVIDQQTVIMDLSGLSLKQMSPTFFAVFRRISTMYQDNYPETMRTMFLVNIPSFFHMAWRMVSAALDDRVKNKIYFLRNRDLGVLQDFIDEKYLPVELGGSNTGVGGSCVNSPNGYIPPVHRAMREEIFRRKQGIIRSSDSGVLQSKNEDNEVAMGGENKDATGRTFSGEELLSGSIANRAINDRSTGSLDSSAGLDTSGCASDTGSSGAQLDRLAAADAEPRRQLSLKVSSPPTAKPMRRWAPRLWRRSRDSRDSLLENQQQTPRSAPSSSSPRTTTPPTTPRRRWQRLMCLKPPDVKFKEAPVPRTSDPKSGLGIFRRQQNRRLRRGFQSMHDIGIGSFDNLSESDRAKDDAGVPFNLPGSPSYATTPRSPLGQHLSHTGNKFQSCMDFQILDADSRKGHPGSSMRGALPAVVSEDGDPASHQRRHDRSVQTDATCSRSAAAVARTTGSMSYFTPRVVAVMGALLVAFVALWFGIAATAPENKAADMMIVDSHLSHQ